MADDVFASGSDYLVPLLRLIAEQPGGVCHPKEVLRVFEATYGARIPPSEQQYVPGAGDTRRWHSLVSGASAPLFQRGLLARADRGAWSITERGRVWLTEHPDATNLDVGSVRVPAARSAEPSTDADLLAAVRQPLRRIDDYLQGHAADRPTDEVLCDWIHFCYIFGLHRRAADLWPYVVREKVNPWHYERTQKIVRACRARLGR
jgi:hypothetical protein